MLEEVIGLLEAMGIFVVSDDALLAFMVKSVTERICNETNLLVIPEGLHYAAVEMVVGEYLSLKKGSGQLDGFDLDAAIKQIQEGDTSITYAVGEGSTTPEARLDGLISFLTKDRTPEFLRYRKLLW